ncbi:hypothetical protein PENTCL1PPCAC_23313, partial [Pristionchus entomophagus]
ANTSSSSLSDEESSYELIDNEVSSVKTTKLPQSVDELSLKEKEVADKETKADEDVKESQDGAVERKKRDMGTSDSEMKLLREMLAMKDAEIERLSRVKQELKGKDQATSKKKKRCSKQFRREW